MNMRVRGIRGAITVHGNDAAAMLQATRELVISMITTNAVEATDVCSVIITCTPDLTAVFPASVVRSVPGYERVPLMCMQEMAVPEALPRCIRLLMHVNTTKEQAEIEHIYLREAVVLRPDLMRSE
jgi:chorismate mutase